MGESKGYRVTIEKQIFGGLGNVDVFLERNGTSIACEISITSTAEYELGNIQKCLASGYEDIIVISSDKRILVHIADAALSHLSKEELAKVKFLTPSDFLPFLEQKDAADAGRKQTVRGYKVNVNYKALNETEKKARKQAIAKTILDAMKRMKDQRSDRYDQ
jgi:hypothetical protein